MLPKEYIEFWGFLKARRKIQFFFILILILITAFSEVVSIGSIVPFIGVMTSPDTIYKSGKLQFLWILLRVNSPSDIIFPLTIFFSLAAIFAAITRLTLLYLSNRVSFSTGSEISTDIYRRTLYQPYSMHVSRNSSEIISGIVNKAGAIVSYLILPSITIITSSVLLIVILSGLFIIDPTITSIAFLTFTSMYFMIALFTKKKLARNSKNIVNESAILHKSLQEGLGGIRDVLLDGTQEYFLNIFRNSDSRLRKISATNSYISQSPRFIIESFGMVSLSIFSYYLIHKNTPVLEIIPVIGALGLGAQRMLPLLQQFYTSWVNLKAGKDTVIQVNQLLKQDLPYYYNNIEISKLEILSEIRLVNIDFKYQTDGNLILSNLNMVIPKGSRLGIIGKTGSGKSTLIDIIMGLLEPTYGKILIDNTIIDKKNVRSWQRQIAHVPQFIYLSDSSITENIAFGIPIQSIDMDKVIQSAKKAQIYEYINTLKDKFQTSVGERGVRLSGGQRQRIGIARALYKEASIIIFDEATSALDIETEKAVMESIEKLDKNLTILIITHRLTTIEKCNLVYEVENGKITQKYLSTK